MGGWTKKRTEKGDLGHDMDHDHHKVEVNSTELINLDEMDAITETETLPPSSGDIGGRFGNGGMAVVEGGKVLTIGGWDEDNAHVSTYRWSRKF